MVLLTVTGGLWSCQLTAIAAISVSLGLFLGEWMKTVLVTGLRGKTGRQVASALIRRKGVAVHGAGRNVAELNFPGVNISRFDWEDSASWPGALAGVDSIYLVKPKTADPAGTVASSCGWQQVLNGSYSCRSSTPAIGTKRRTNGKSKELSNRCQLSGRFCDRTGSCRISLNHRFTSKLSAMPANSNYRQAVNRQVLSTRAILRTLRQPLSWIRVMQGGLTL
jgi:hypothetical protein